MHSDFVQPFLIDHSSIRGRLVRVNKVLDDIIKAHHYPDIVSVHLAEQIVIAALLSATLDKDGILTVQIKGEGAVRVMVVDIMAGGILRGYASIDKTSLKEVARRSKIKKHSVSEIIGKGYLAVTLDEGKSKQRYQGIVELQGKTVTEAFKGYFLQSQQGEIQVNVAVRTPTAKNKGWAAGGIIIERMPVLGGKQKDVTDEEQNDTWERTKLFMQTLKDEELLDTKVTPQNLLYRLFSEDGVWVYKLQPLKAGCRCSRLRVRNILKTLAKEELLDTLDDKGKLSVNCQFCNKNEVFTRAEINRLFRTTATRSP